MIYFFVFWSSLNINFLLKIYVKWWTNTNMDKTFIISSFKFRLLLSVSGVRVTRSLVLYVMFVDRCLSFCPFSFELWTLSFDLRILIFPLVSSNSSYDLFFKFSEYQLSTKAYVKRWTNTNMDKILLQVHVSVIKICLRTKLRALLKKKY